MKVLSVDEFVRFPLCTYTFVTRGIILLRTNQEDVCHMSCENVCRLKNAVLASDNRFYEGRMLQTWLAMRREDAMHVIPGNPITHVYIYNWTDLFAQFLHHKVRVVLLDTFKTHARSLICFCFVCLHSFYATLTCLAFYTARVGWMTRQWLQILALYSMRVSLDWNPQLLFRSVETLGKKRSNPAKVSCGIQCDLGTPPCQSPSRCESPPPCASRTKDKVFVRPLRSPQKVCIPSTHSAFTKIRKFETY